MTTRARLAVIPELAAEAWATTGTQPVSDDSPRRPTVPGSRILADLDRLLTFAPTPPRNYPPRHTEPDDQATASVGSLYGWVRVHHDNETADGISTWWPEGTVAAACMWLESRATWAERQEWADEYAEDVRLLHNQLRAICRIRTTHPTECLTPGCGMRMDLMGDVYRCTEGHEHEGPDRLATKWMRAPSMPTEEIVAQGWATADQLRQWLHRGQIKRDESKGRRPSWWWPWDVLCLREPSLRERFPDADTPQPSHNHAVIELALRS